MRWWPQVLFISESFLSVLFKAASMKEGKLTCGIGTVHSAAHISSAALPCVATSPPDKLHHVSLNPDIFFSLYLNICLSLSLIHPFAHSVPSAWSALPCHIFLTSSNSTFSTHVSPPLGRLCWYLSHHSYCTELPLFHVSVHHQNKLFEARIMFWLSLGP